MPLYKKAQQAKHQFIKNLLHDVPFKTYQTIKILSVLKKKKS
ncbi:hypothetical protein [Candidatus Arsenophonus triatominarum]|nr:hypothetical protein [Candidatus Arsenophonus triatominarum]